MHFLSDNVSGASPEIVEAIARVSEDLLPPYGNDALTARVEARLREIFETDLVAFPVATGTGANALSLSALSPPFGSIYCHRDAHIIADECGAVEFYTGGARLVPVDGADGKIDIGGLERALVKGRNGVVHAVQPAALSLTQPSEAGTCYRPAELAAICGLAKRHGLKVHMDGARFANALVFLRSSPAEITWRAGVDILAFGATKNGAFAAEVVVIFDPKIAENFKYRRKRAGHLFSKMRFITAQLDAYFADDLWMRNATVANARAAELAEGLRSTGLATIAAPVEANEVFAELPDAVIRALDRDGWPLRRWSDPDGNLLRLVTAFDTRQSDVAEFVAAVGRHASASNH